MHQCMDLAFPRSSGSLGPKWTCGLLTAALRMMHMQAAAHAPAHGPGHPALKRLPRTCLDSLLTAGPVHEQEKRQKRLEEDAKRLGMTHVFKGQKLGSSATQVAGA